MKSLKERQCKGWNNAKTAAKTAAKTDRQKKARIRLSIGSVILASIGGENPSTQFKVLF